MEKPNFILSEDMKRLLYAKALIVEIGNEVCEVLANTYGEDVQDKLFDQFLEKFTYPLEEELDRFIGINISDKISEMGCLRKKEIVI